MSDGLFSKMPHVFPRTWLRELTGAETKIVVMVIDETFGWQHEWAEISIEQFMEGTGLSRPAVIEAIWKSRERGLLLRKQSGHGFRYKLSRVTELKAVPERPPGARQRMLPLNVNELPTVKKVNSSETTQEFTNLTVEELEKLTLEPPVLNIDLKKTHTQRNAASKEKNKNVCVDRLSEFSDDELAQYANAQTPKLGTGWIFVRGQDAKADDMVRRFFEEQKRRRELEERRRFQRQQKENTADADRPSRDEIRDILKNATKGG